MQYEMINPPKVADAIVSQIEQLILEGVLKPGERLPPERELAQQLNVSRPSLREAITTLKSRGLQRVGEVEETLSSTSSRPLSPIP
jgi:GntR family transcriptional repressor for pyruvate dehydrogenase complex